MLTGPMGRWLRVAGAATLVVALAPLTGGGTAQASQGGEDHKVTLCHRTNSENNPYVQITIDKAAVFRQGHDGHDEGGVYQPGDKARGVRWGDIIPSFTYTAGPKDPTVLTYPGLNNGPEGMAILANGCEVPGHPGEEPHPDGSLHGECIEAEGTEGSFVVSGTLDADGAEHASFRLLLSTGAVLPLEGTTFEETIEAPAGTTVQLQYSVNGGETWTDTGESVTVTDCPQGPHEVDATGSFSVACDEDGAVVTIGTLSHEAGVTWRLFVNGSPQDVVSAQVIQVPGGASLDLRSRYQGEDTSEQQGTAPAACHALPPHQPAQGSFTTECTPTAAQADIGTLDEGAASDGSYRLVATGFSVTVTSGQQDVPVPAGTTLTLEYVPDDHAAHAQVLDTETSPAPCPETGTVSKSSAPASGSTVAAGSTISYTVTVSNTGTVQLVDKKVVDTLPSFVAVSGTPSDGGVVSTDGRTITWTVTLAPSASRTFTYTGLVSANAPVGESLVNTVTFLDQTGTTRHVVGASASNLVETPLVAVAGVKTGGSTPTGTAGTPETVAGTGVQGTGAGVQGGDTGVQGVKTGPAVLAATGATFPLSGFVALGGALLLMGAALLRVAVLRPSRD